MPLGLHPGDKVVFIGDSITDAGRQNRRTPLGTGFVREFAKLLRSQNASLYVEVVNKGTGGDRSCDLVGRWTADVIDQKPTWVVICVGVNDVWRKFDRLAEPVELKPYEAFLRTMVSRTRAETDAQILFIEPFVAEKNTEDPFRADIERYAAVVRRLGEEFGVPVVRLQELFDSEMALRKSSKLSSDRVHPTPLGHRLIAEAVWRTFESLT